MKPSISRSGTQSSRATKKIKPGQPGALRWQARFGADLVCVRYRLDAARHLRYTTVEIVVETRPVKPRKDARIVMLKVHYLDRLLHQELREAGGKWNNQLKVWELPYDSAKALGLLGRIVLHNG